MPDADRIRTEDLVVDGRRMEPWEVRIIDTEHVRCRHVERPQNRRFRRADLEEVDEGLWQEVRRA